MDRLYTYCDYEEAYYHCCIAECIEIGTYLLSKLKDDRAVKLIKELKKVKVNKLLSQPDLEKLTELLLQVKI